MRKQSRQKRKKETVYLEILEDQWEVVLCETKEPEDTRISSSLDFSLFAVWTGKLLKDLKQDQQC